MKAKTKAATKAKTTTQAKAKKNKVKGMGTREKPWVLKTPS